MVQLYPKDARFQSLRKKTFNCTKQGMVIKQKHDHLFKGKFTDYKSGTYLYLLKKSV
jgi:hypothetical protein